MGAEWRIPAAERLLAKTVRSDSGCLMWTGIRTSDGYGRMGYQGRNSVSVHRVAYMEWIGPIPDDMQPDHLCHTRDTNCAGGPTCPHRLCVEPTHLELVSADENVRRGRSFSVVNAAKDRCPAGHLYDVNNTIHYQGRRYCRPCTNRRNRDYKTRKRALPC